MSACDPLRGPVSPPDLTISADSNVARSSGTTRSFEVGASPGSAAEARRATNDAMTPSTPVDDERIKFIRSCVGEGLPMDTMIERVVEHELACQFGPAAASLVPTEVRAAIVEQFKCDPALHALIERVMVDASAR